jgi:S-adenosylmethionine decarboxylase
LSHSRTRIFHFFDLILTEFQDNFPELDAGEWVYWPNVNLGIGATGELPEQSYDSFRFEGPEKKLEMHFRPIVGNSRGLREIEKSTWDEILALSHISIISIKSNEHFDAYLLSESSMFVYPYKIYLKTCGISSPLLCTPSIADMSERLRTPLERVLYSRRNFLFPQSQCFPHRSTDEEEGYLKQFFPSGQSVHLGKLDDPDHWFLFEAILPNSPSASPRESEVVPPSFEITMTGKLCPRTMANFWAVNNGLAGNPGELKIAEKAGISQLIEGVDIDEYAFSPCGFSLNGLKDEGFITVHITPQDEFAYVSFETNIAGVDYHKLRDGLLQLFRPEKFTMLITNSASTITDLTDTEYLLSARTDSLLNGLPVFFERCQRTDLPVESTEIVSECKQILQTLRLTPGALDSTPLVAQEETWS